MKVIGEQLIDGIKLNSEGNVEIDAGRLNPKCIEVTENSVNMEVVNRRAMQQQRAAAVASTGPNTGGSAIEYRKILLKQTRFFSK